MELVESNEYRVLKMCSNCPFRDNGKAMHLKEGRVDQLKEMLRSDSMNSFNCHKTVYDLDTDMNTSGSNQALKMCAGAYEYLKSINQPNIQMSLAEAWGIEKD